MASWRPARASRNGPKISNLAFAKDLILFAETTTYQARIIAHCLEQFSEALGNKVSFSKSRVSFFSNTPSSTRAEICDTLQINETKDFGMYLGVPTINGRSSKKRVPVLSG